MMDCTPVLHVAAYHASPGYNGDTPGLGALCALKPALHAAVGTYRNSVNRQSNYGAVVWRPVATLDWDYPVGSQWLNSASIWSTHD